MNPIRQIAFYLTAVLFSACLIQGEMVWISEYSGKRMPAEQNDADLFQEYQQAVEAVWEELEWFPIPLSDTNPRAEVTFENSWLAERNYGGMRQHEGTDLMAAIDQAGYYPVISITDGTVEQIGWLEKGGWRIGIRSGNGNYYYYAHLHSYASEWKAGDAVQAGELLGYMGDSGYGPEGTTGEFPVHLHLGIYLPLGADQEKAVNPYWMLRYLESRKLTYVY